MCNDDCVRFFCANIFFVIDLKWVKPKPSTCIQMNTTKPTVSANKKELEFDDVCWSKLNYNIYILDNDEQKAKTILPLNKIIVIDVCMCSLGK